MDHGTLLDNQEVLARVGISQFVQAVRQELRAMVTQEWDAIAPVSYTHLPDAKGIQIIPSQFPAGMLTLPVGGFLVLGCLIAAMQWALSRPKKNKEESK